MVEEVDKDIKAKHYILLQLFLQLERTPHLFRENDEGKQKSCVK